MASAIHAEIERLKKEDISDEELKMIKTRAKANLIRSLGSNEGLAIALSLNQSRYDDWRELFRSVDRIDKVTKADIRRVANQTFVPITGRWDYRVCRRASGSGRSAARRWTVKRAHPAPKGASDFRGLAVSLKRYPDTKLLVVLAVVLLISFFNGNMQLWAQAPAWRQIPIPKLPAFHPAQPKRIELPNGMVVFFRKTTSCRPSMAPLAFAAASARFRRTRQG